MPDAGDIWPETASETERQREIRVLLFSPLSGRDPESGDTSYTAALLMNPPPHVRYITYEEALDRGIMTVLGRRPGTSQGGSLEILLFALRFLEWTLRHCGVMFREPTWFVHIDPDRVDVVHQHLFAVRQISSRVPVFSSAGYPLPELYRHREGWWGVRLGLATMLEKAWSRALRVHTPWLHHVAPALMSGYSARFVEYLIRQGCPAGDVQVLSTALPVLTDLRKRSRTDDSPVMILFVGRDYLLKGGSVAVEAMTLVQRAAPVLGVVVTSSGAAPLRRARNIEWLLDVPRRELVGKVLPRADILLLPTSADCGAPYTMLESMQAGLAIVTSEIPWLDSRLTLPGVTRVPSDPALLAEVLLALIADPAKLLEAQEAARALWESTFSMKEWGASLEAAYRSAMNRTAAVRRRLDKRFYR